jgi:hypothetical protein
MPVLIREVLIENVSRAIEVGKHPEKYGEGDANLFE